jgi:hypothetical protein
MKDDRLYLIHVKECIQRIDSYASEGRDVFLRSSMVQGFIHLPGNIFSAHTGFQGAQSARQPLPLAELKLNCRSQENTNNN